LTLCVDRKSHALFPWAFTVKVWDVWLSRSSTWWRW